jgi:tRNA (cmo5U34)-methyltransferase
MDEAADRMFAQPKPAEDFNFGRKTAEVFDDMLARSVPFYAEIQRMITELAADFAVKDTNLYDLGCSTCTTFLALDPVVEPSVKFIGIDSSPEMLQRGADKLTQSGTARRYELVHADLNDTVAINDASVVIMNLTLQFVRPLRRQQLMAAIAQGMRPDGCLLLIEKVLSRESTLNRFFIKYYYGFKQRNGYSAMEISQKREALENVLVPYRTEENAELLRSSGFQWSELFFKWYNFSGVVAVK